MPEELVRLADCVDVGPYQPVICRGPELHFVGVKKNLVVYLFFGHFWTIYRGPRTPFITSGGPSSTGCLNCFFFFFFLGGVSNTS